MFYFTCNESKIYESFTFWNNLQEKIFFFTTFLFIEMHLYILCESANCQFECSNFIYLLGGGGGV